MTPEQRWLQWTCQFPALPRDPFPCVSLTKRQDVGNPPATKQGQPRSTQLRLAPRCHLHSKALGRWGTKGALSQQFCKVSCFLANSVKHSWQSFAHRAALNVKQSKDYR